MRQSLSFLSLIALAVLAAGMVGVVGLGPIDGHTSAGATAGTFTLDYRSLLLGTIFGVALSALIRLSWAELPRRTIAWFYANERRLIRCGYAGILLGVLLFY